MSTDKKIDNDNYFRPQQGLDEALQRELDEALGDRSIEDLMDADSGDDVAGRPSAAKGVRSGKVIAIQGDDVFVDMGGRSEGVLPAEQFKEEPLPEVGDSVEVTIEGYDQADGLLRLSREGAVLAAAWDTIEEGQIVEGRVTGHNKGGLELDVNGINAFMPISQVERFHVEDLAEYLNQRLRCSIMEIDHAAENVVVSRRELLEQEAAEARESLFESLQPDQVVSGVVRSIMPYGAFVDIGGVDGLLHVSDMSHGRVEDPSSIVSVGEGVEVMVLKVDREQRRVSLGLKQVLPDPWHDAQEKWGPDDVVSGRVTRLADFGAFVELEAGVEGLVPIGEMTFERRIRHPGEIVSEGDVVRIRVMNVDTQRRRISLSLKRVGDDPWIGASIRWPVGDAVEGVVTRIADFGAFVELTGGVEGLVHISELSNERVRGVGDVLREGQTARVKVLSVDEEARRISLSVKQLVEAPDDDTTRQEGPARAPRKRKKPLKGGLE